MDSEQLDKHQESDMLTKDIAHDKSLEDLQEQKPKKKKRKRVATGEPERVFSTKEEVK